MSQAAEHALRQLADDLQAEADAVGTGTVYGVLAAMARAHRRTADTLKTEREAREAGLARKPGDVTYNPKGKGNGNGSRNK